MNKPGGHVGPVVVLLGAFHAGQHLVFGGTVGVVGVELVEAQVLVFYELEGGYWSGPNS